MRLGQEKTKESESGDCKKAFLGSVYFSFHLKTKAQRFPCVHWPAVLTSQLTKGQFHRQSIKIVP